MWTNDSCKKCKKQNWINLGDAEDCTGYDREGFKCWKCKTENIFQSTIDFLNETGENTEDYVFYIEDGLRCPSNNCKQNRK